MNNFNEMDLNLLDSLLNEKINNLNKTLNNKELSDLQTDKLEDEKFGLYVLRTKLFSNLLKGSK